MVRRSLVALVVFVSLIGSIVPAATAQTSERCFPETGQCIRGVIRAYWENNGGLPVFGFPITALATETNAEGFTGPTQWFERDRLEDHTPEGKGVLAGRLGAQKLAMEGRPWETLPKGIPMGSDCLFFSQTSHSLCPPFRAYWERNGGLARFGFPISEPGTERNADGFTGTFQWFERRRMEAHPENRPPYDILLGLLGKEVRAAIPPPAPIVISGRGDVVSQPFTLPAGLYLAESRYTGRSNFIVTLLDAAGKYVELLANDIGDTQAVEAVYVKTTAQYVLEVQSEGTWEVKFRQPSNAEVTGGPTVPTTVTGQGNATLFVNLPAGLNRFQYTYTGESNFIVVVEDLEGGYVGLAANEIGNATGSRAVRAPRNGSYILNIESSGTWSITITQ